MKQKTSTFFGKKRYLLSVATIAAAVLSSVPAFSQVDYFYGLNKKGFRVSVGGGAGKLDSSWGSAPPGAAATANIDYDFSQYFSIGLSGQYGKMTGRDTKSKLTVGGTDVVFGGGDLNFKLAIGQFEKRPPRNIFGDIIRRVYVGSGIGIVSSSVTVYTHAHFGTPSNVNESNAYLQPSMKNFINSGQTAKGSGSFAYVPVNVGTYISLRKLTKKDKIELNPNYEYCFVQSPVFDGYQPATRQIGSVKANGNQGYMLISLSLRYKF